MEGRPLRRKDIDENEDLPHPSIYNERFGSFQEAKEQAGVRQALKRIKNLKSRGELIRSSPLGIDFNRCTPGKANLQMLLVEN